MKKILFLLSILISLKSFSQIPPEGSYTQNLELDKFVGTWIWTSGNDTMKIVLQKQKVHYKTPFNFDRDQLLGWHSYKKNGVLIESCLQFAGQLFGTSPLSLYGSTTNPRQIRFTSFKDITKNKRSDRLFFTMLRNSTTQAQWKLEESHGMRYGTPNYGFTVPTNVIFTKQ
jgi:hypothetical protein